MPKAERKLKMREGRILSCLFALRESGYEVTEDGLVRIMRGTITEENLFLKDEAVFGQAPSVSPKLLKSRIRELHKWGYIALVYAEGADGYILRLTPKSEAIGNKLPSLKKKKAVLGRFSIRKIK